MSRRTARTPRQGERMTGRIGRIRRSRRHRLAAWLCATLLGAAALALAVGEPCDEAGCPEGQTCVDSLCRPDEPCSGPDCLPDTPCASDADCPSYQACVDGVCENLPLPECGAVVACPDGQVCDSGHCVGAPADECSHTRPCPDGEICVAGRCDPGEPTGCQSDTECPGGSVCQGGRCVSRIYDPPALTPLDLPEPPTTRTHADDPPVWNLPDDDDPFGDVTPMPPQACGTDAGGDYVCCSHGRGWSFEKDQVDDLGFSLYEPWAASGTAFARGPVYGNNVHIDRIEPPGYTSSAAAGPAANVGGDYWAFSRDVNQQGKWWIGSSDLRADPKDLPGGRLAEKATGRLRSPRMKIDADYIRFFIGGRSMPSQRVQLEIYEPNPVERAKLAKLYDGIGVSELPGAATYLPVPPANLKWVVVRASAPSDSNEFMHRRVVWDVKDFKGKIARIHIIDSNRWGWHPIGHGHVNVDEVLCTDELDDGPTFLPPPPGGREPAKVGAKETPIPLWGTTDTHAHPFANLAFGGNLQWGDPHDELADVYSCNGELPAIGEGSNPLRPEVHQHPADQCGASELLNATVAALPCFLFANNIASWPISVTCAEAVWDVLDVLMNMSLVQVESLHGSPSPFSGGVTITGAREVLQELTPFMNTLRDLGPYPKDVFPDLAVLAASLPEHVAGLVERLAWDTDDGRHSQHGIKGHQIYQKDMIRRAHQGGLRLIGLDVIDSRTITSSLGALYDEWRVIRDTVYSARHLVSCGDDPLFPTPGPLCDIAGIAYSPADVRSLVAANKLAIVLGTETDELGVPRDPITMGLFGHPGVTDSIDLQIEDLHALGIRKVTAIHALNNPLGGAGIFNDTYLTGTNELSNVLDPGKVERSSLTIPFFVAGNFTEDMFAIKHWETDPDDLSWTEWYQDHGGWVALDQTLGDDWIGGGVTFKYGFPSVATPLGFPANSENVGGVPAFTSKGTWSGVDEVQHLKDVDQLLKGGDMCKVDGAGLPLGAKVDWVPDEVKEEYASNQGFANAVGLRPAGKHAIELLMQRGMIIDLDHFSQEARVDTHEVAKQAGKWVFEDEERLYPFFGVHTNSRTHERHGPFPDVDALRSQRGYTAETDRTLPEFVRSKQDGGTFSPGANAGYMTDSPEHEPQVRNDCDYSAKSFAHRYLWMMGVMEGRGLTPSTDMSPFFTPAAPRFGQYQCHLRTSYHDDMFGLSTADGEFYRLCPPDFPALATEQCKSHQWPHDWQPDEPGKEMCKIWGRITPGCPTYDNLQRQYAEGAGVWYEDYSGREDDEQPTQDAAGPQVTWIVARRSWEERDDAAPRAEVDERVAIGGARQMWPMKKMKTAAGWKLDQAKNTGWDVNLDGFQHIGLYPDFLQDVRNVGVSWERMTPMFNAVEDYVRMWERQCELADRWAANDASVPGCQ